MIEVESEGFVKWLKSAAKQLKAKTQLAVRRTAEASATYARLSRLYKSHTYGLRSSIHTAVEPTSSKVIADAKYAYFVENGTRPHRIEARRKKVLRFEMNGEIVFRRQVFHPGTVKRPFMAEAQERATPLFSRLVTEAATFT